MNLFFIILLFIGLCASIFTIAYAFYLLITLKEDDPDILLTFPMAVVPVPMFVGSIVGLYNLIIKGISI